MGSYGKYLYVHTWPHTGQNSQALAFALHVANARQMLMLRRAMNTCVYVLYIRSVVTNWPHLILTNHSPSHVHPTGNMKSVFGRLSYQHTVWMHKAGQISKYMPNLNHSRSNGLIQVLYIQPLLTFPWESENLCWLRPSVPQEPWTLAWFSYCTGQEGGNVANRVA